jgi:predicted RNase H-like HicB family nuclease
VKQTTKVAGALWMETLRDQGQPVPPPESAIDIVEAA